MRRSLPVQAGIVAVEEIGQADSTEIRTPFQEHIEQIEPTGEGQDPEDSHVREWERSRYRGVREPETRLPTSSAIPSSERARCCQHARRDRVRQLREPGEARSSKSKHPAAAKRHAAEDRDAAVVSLIVERRTQQISAMRRMEGKRSVCEIDRVKWHFQSSCARQTRNWPRRR
jgi:hypothetical protein